MSESLGLFEAEPAPKAPPIVNPVPEIPVDWEPEVRIPAPPSLEIVVDQERVDTVLGILLETYKANGFPYNQEGAKLPHDPAHMPKTLERGSRDHAMLLWNVCYYMRGGIKSVDAFKRMSKLYDDRPDLYDPEIAAHADPEDITKELKGHGLGFQNVVSRQWIINSQRLVERYDGDPRNIFDGVKTYEECLERIQNRSKDRGFIGFQEKMASMITYYMAYEDMIEPYLFPIPVDLHVMRVSIANKLVTFPGIEPGTNVYSQELLATLRNIYSNYAAENEVNPLQLCDAVWLLSESSCGSHPGNITLEPHGRENRKGRSTYLIPLEVDTSNPQQQRAYEASCRQCPLEDYCEYNIPGKHYYVGGGLIIRGKRVRFPLLPPEPEVETLF